MSLILFVITWIILQGAVDGGFDRDVQVYEGVIRNINLHFRNSHIILLYAIDDYGKE